MTQHNLIDVIVTDHREVEQVFQELESGAGTPQHRRSLVDHVITELVRHSVAEEQHMYPAARSALPDGDSVVDHELEEHAGAEETMKSLDGLDATDDRFEPLVRELIDEIRHHVEEEETDLLPKLREHCTEAQLEELGEKVVKAKGSAPTHPHPSAPDKPPANRILDPGAGLIDRMRDRLAGK